MVMASEIKNTMNTMGTFSTPSSLAIGDPYDKPRQADAARGLRNFTTNPMRNDAHMKNYKRLFEGERWVSDFERTRKFAISEKQKNLTPDGFKYSSPAKKSSGLGNYYGTIGGKMSHSGEKESLDPRSVGKGEVHSEPRQMMTAPSKSGRFNTPGILFGAPQPKGVAHVLGKEFEYMSDPYNSARKLEMDMRAESKKKRQGAPFSAIAPSRDYFDQTKHGLSSSVYARVELPEAKAPPKGPRDASLEKPFYPSRPAKSGYQGALNRFPEHIPDPETERMKAEKAMRDKWQPVSSQAWRIGAGPKSAPSRSILHHVPGMSTLG